MPNSAVRRVCLVVGGGDAPGVNATLRAFVHAAQRRSLEVLGSQYGFEGLLADDGIVPVAVADVRGVLPRGGSFLGCSTRINPFFVTTEQGEIRDMGSAVVSRLREHGADALVLIGGDGTMLAARQFVRLGMPCVGIAKTIDNDMSCADVTCGFDTAVGAATRAIDALHSTAEAHARVMLVEVMGRHAGWLALAAGVAGGADVILLPEIPYDILRIVAKILQREALGRRFSIIVVSEGARPIGGDVAEIEPGRPGYLPRLGGAGARLAEALTSLRLEHEVRLTVLGHLQRGGTPTAFDRLLGTRLGARAADLCRAGIFGQVVAFKGGRVHEVPLEEVSHRPIEPSSLLLAAARDVGIELGS